MNTDNEDIGEEEDDAPTGVRASLDAVIGDSEGSELDDFEPDMYADEEQDGEDNSFVTDDPDAEETANIAADAKNAALGSTEKPPLDWGVEVREQWKDLPDSVKKHLHARDAHVNTMLQDGAANRKMGEGLNNISQGYKAIMDAEGVTNPLQAVDGLFKSVATLRMGTQAEKAAKIAQFVQAYGVDINALDNALVGNPVSEADPMEAMIDQRMAPVNQLLEQLNQNKQYQTQQQQQQTNANIAQFAQTAEFLEDVRDDMADLLEGAARRNVKMSLQQAYDKACAINPEISNVLATRNTNAAMMGSRNNMAAKRNAASSINGNSGGHANAPSSGGLRGALESAFEDHA
jgi:hypothetical protein